MTEHETKERKCLKFTGYIFLPSEDDDANDIRYYASRTPGRITMFDEHGKRAEKAIAFENLGKMVDIIETKRRKLVYKRVKRK